MVCMCVYVFFFSVFVKSVCACELKILHNSLLTDNSRHHQRESSEPLAVGDVQQDLFVLAGYPISLSPNTLAGTRALYRWFKDGDALGSSSKSMEIASASVPFSGRYVCEVSAARGSPKEFIFNLHVIRLQYTSEGCNFWSCGGVIRGMVTLGMFAPLPNRDFFVSLELGGQVKTFSATSQALPPGLAEFRVEFDLIKLQMFLTRGDANPVEVKEQAAPPSYTESETEAATRRALQQQQQQQQHQQQQPQLQQQPLQHQAQPQPQPQRSPRQQQQPRHFQAQLVQQQIRQERTLTNESLVSDTLYPLDESADATYQETEA